MSDWHTQSAEERLAQTVFLIEADSFARLSLWSEWERGQWNPFVRTWEQICVGSSVQVGECAGMPVQLLLFWARLNGRLVAFYETPSAVVDHRLVDAWLRRHCAATYDGGGRRAHCDAMNFHLCAHALHEAAP